MQARMMAKLVKEGADMLLLDAHWSRLTGWTLFVGGIGIDKLYRAD